MSDETPERRAPRVHPSAILEPGVLLGQGVSIWHFCHVRAGAEIGDEVSLGQGCYVAATARLGRGSRVQNNVSLYDGVWLEEEVFVGPSVVFTNVRTPRAHTPRADAFLPTHVGRGVSIGANATIVCGVRIGHDALIGAGSVVTRDVPPHALMMGNPARQRGWACRCGARLEEVSPSQLTCPECGRRYRVQGEGLHALEL